jgi:PIN domain nuclease of toxin-antitoxin system
VSAVILDTHAWVWSFHNSAKLSPTAKAALTTADVILVSPISFYEVGLKTSLGKWAEMEPFANDLVGILNSQGGREAPFTAEICQLAGTWNWAHRDPFDRLIAATAKALNTPLVTRDTAFNGFDDIEVIW